MSKADKIREIITIQQDKLSALDNSDNAKDRERADLLRRLVNKFADLYGSTPDTTKDSKKPLKVPVKQITVVWSEWRINGKDDNIIFYDWEDFNGAMAIASKESEEYAVEHDREGGYNKVKIEIEWEDGSRIVDRVDLGSSEGDYLWARDNSIGEYLSKRSGVMYESNLEEGQRETLDWGLFEEKPKEDKKDSALLPLTSIVIDRYERDTNLHIGTEKFYTWEAANEYTQELDRLKDSYKYMVEARWTDMAAFVLINGDNFNPKELTLGKFIQQEKAEDFKRDFGSDIKDYDLGSMEVKAQKTAKKKKKSTTKKLHVDVDDDFLDALFD